MLSGHFVEINDFLIYVHPKVYPPSDDTFALVEALEMLPDSTEEEMAIDIGCGCGILALIMARKGYKVIGTDINPYAIKCSIINSYINGLRYKIRFIQGDLFAGVEFKFRVVVFNPPYLPPSESLKDDYLAMSTEGGLQVIMRFLRLLSHHLAPNGEALIVAPDIYHDTLLRMSKELGFSMDTVSERKLAWERLLVIRVIRSS